MAQITPATLPMILRADRMRGLFQLKLRIIGGAAVMPRM
jgi:hypothetical protein